MYLAASRFLRRQVTIQLRGSSEQIMASANISILLDKEISHRPSPSFFRTAVTLQCHISVADLVVHTDRTIGVLTLTNS
jgi:hypothetical protein